MKGRYDFWAVVYNKIIDSAIVKNRVYELESIRIILFGINPVVVDDDMKKYYCVFGGGRGGRELICDMV
jgi:hypothetical protein